MAARSPTNGASSPTRGVEDILAEKRRQADQLQEVANALHQALLQRGANPTLRDGEADSIVKRNTPRDLTTDVHVRNCLLEAERNRSSE